MDQKIDNRLNGCNVEGDYVGGNQTNNYYNMFQDSEREFVVTHNANIMPTSYFTGRETELNDLCQRVEEGRKAVLVSGMGGIGKTHICRKMFKEYFDKHSKGENVPFQHIGFVEYSGDMNNDLQKCLKYKQQEEPKLNREAAWRELDHLASNGKLLLVVDNVNRPMREDPGLERLKGIPGAIILTSRRTTFSKEFEPYMIGFLNIEHCREIYEKIRFMGTGIKIKDEELPDLEYIIEKLAARHTITIEFLASLARTKRWSVERLKEELEQNGFKLEYKNEEDELVNIQESYETLYKLSELTEAEQNILEAFSIFPYIPLSAEICNQWLLSDAGVSEDDDILTGLFQKGWLQFDWEQESYAMHPVFAQFIYDKCKPELEKHLGLIEACRDCLKMLYSSSAQKCQEFIPYAEKIIKRINTGKDIELTALMCTYANLLSYIAEYEKAERIYEELLEIHKTVLGENHLDTASIYYNLACLYETYGKYEKAEELLIKSLRTVECELGKEHTQTADYYNALAAVYKSHGEYSKAEELFKKSLKIYKTVLGENHLDTSNGYNNLAVIYYIKEEFLKAEALFKKCLKIRKSKLGENHPMTATCYNNLAAVYEDQREYEKAMNYYLKSYKNLVSKFGVDHPDPKLVYVNLICLFARWNPEGNFEQWLEEKLKEGE